MVTESAQHTQFFEVVLAIDVMWSFQGKSEEKVAPKLLRVEKGVSGVLAKKKGLSSKRLERADKCKNCVLEALKTIKKNFLLQSGMRDR